MSESSSLALSQLQRVGALHDFLSHPGLELKIPVTMPQSVGSLGFDTSLWVGLGIVGVWAALDAFAERELARVKCSVCDRQTCVWSRFDVKGKIGDSELGELEDLRHLYAHNFAGSTDASYLGRKRHGLKGSPIKLSAGAQFDGARVVLSPADLRHYAQKSTEVVRMYT